MIQTLEDLYEFIYEVIITFLENISATNHTNTKWTEIMISPGIGQVTWFSISLNDLIGIVLYFIIIITLMRYTIKFVKWIWSFARRLFGGR